MHIRDPVKLNLDISVSLDNHHNFVGPRRVNHASVSIGEHIYSFGGYCSGEDYRISRPMDVHVLNTNTLRWSLLPMKKDQKYPQVPFQRYGKHES